MLFCERRWSARVLACPSASPRQLSAPLSPGAVIRCRDPLSSPAASISMHRIPSFSTTMASVCSPTSAPSRK
ncbi:Hypothetical protein CAP_8466 [Chondromyces apiculatus DSM 436]|uniref:Uncharacterized protein n=1 Tax=Chondromyces apiculatus DSM 436 TaxID=1192034 RepID=A0A017SX10_9BACT|nr:Hypothetical protein CAP_8466 [Chondromyces apiculatus DSM 436]